MKHLLIAAAMLVILTGCDQASQNSNVNTPPAKTAATADQYRFDCVDTNTGSRCDIVSGSLDGSRRWIRSTVWFNSSSVDVTIDGENFYSTDMSSQEFRGEKTARIMLKGIKGSSGEISAANGMLSVDAYNADGKRFMTATKTNSH